MKSHEFIQSAADLLQLLSNPGSDVAQQPNQIVLTPVQVHADDDSDTTTMVAPLQQKLELLKKAVDVSSYYDQGEPGYKPSASTSDSEAGEVEDMKKLAGILHNAGDDTDDFEG